MSEQDFQGQGPGEGGFTPDPEPGPIPGPDPIPWPGPDPGPPIPQHPKPLVPWPSRCWRFEPVSGRYEGGEAIAGVPLLLSKLDLRVDVDRAYENSPVMNRVSGDHYRLQSFGRWGIKGWVYRESWIIDAPLVSWERCQVTIDGTVRWWKGTQGPTTAHIVIPWTQGYLGTASVTLSTGASSSTYSCPKSSPFFRTLDLEIDVCKSVNAEPILPSYDTHAHANRPATLTRRTLTIEESYREAGVEVTISPERTVIDDSAAQFSSWSGAELHDAMETHYSRFSGGWPAWRMWGLLAGAYDRADVGGIMFDAASVHGGAGQERQGFAVFRDHLWFDDLPAGAPSTQDEARALRYFLYTYVHEAGHAFNLLHSWDKGRPDSLSWMNYDWRYHEIHGNDTFWARFGFRFDDEELIHIRHGDRAAVIMGGDPWSSGSHMEGPPPLAAAQLEGEAPLELLVRAKPYFELMEPVSVELRLRNLTELPLEVDARLAPDFGAVAVFVQRPDGRIVAYSPILCQLGVADIRTLAPASAEDGLDRYSENVFIAYGAKGFVFDVPGEYLVRAVYQGLGDVLIPSDTARLRVGSPVGIEQDRFAEEYFDDAVGLNLALGGSQSPFLEKGRNTLLRAREEFPETMLAARAAETLGQSAGRSFFRIEEEKREGEEVRLVQTHEADPELQLQLTEPALETFRRIDDPHLNLSHHELVASRAEALTAAGQEEAAREELSTLASDLEGRGVNPVVLADIRGSAEGR